MAIFVFGNSGGLATNINCEPKTTHVCLHANRSSKRSANHDFITMQVTVVQTRNTCMAGMSALVNSTSP